jgi:hypothetical protein
MSTSIRVWILLFTTRFINIRGYQMLPIPGTEIQIHAQQNFYPLICIAIFTRSPAELLFLLLYMPAEVSSLFLLFSEWSSNSFVSFFFSGTTVAKLRRAFLLAAARSIAFFLLCMPMAVSSLLFF